MLFSNFVHKVSETTDQYVIFWKTSGKVFMDQNIFLTFKFFKGSILSFVLKHNFMKSIYINLHIQKHIKQSKKYPLFINTNDMTRQNSMNNQNFSLTGNDQHVNIVDSFGQSTGQPVQTTVYLHHSFHSVQTDGFSDSAL